MRNHHSAGPNAGVVPDTVTKIVAGLYIARPLTTSFAGINLASNVLAHPLPNCRLYCSQVKVDPQNPFNFLANSGVVHLTAVLICSFIVVANSGFGDFQRKSPFDTVPQTPE